MWWINCHLAAVNADADSVSAGKLADAIALMSKVRAGLIRDADRLTDTMPSP